MKEEKERQMQVDQYQETRNKAISVNGQDALGILAQSVAKHIAVFNENISDPRQKLTTPEILGSTRFQVTRGHDLIFVLTVRLDSSNNALAWDMVRSTSNGTLYASQDSFQLQLNSAGEILFMHSGAPLSLEAATRKLILPAIEGLV
jgi:hypothetical protein